MQNMTWSDRNYVYSVNDHDLKIYKVPLSDFDSNHSEYDSVLHSIHQEWIAPARNICMYCEAEFESRNKLFQHLGFMNVNIQRPKRKKSILRKRKYSLISVNSLEEQLFNLNLTSEVI